MTARYCHVCRLLLAYIDQSGFDVVVRTFVSQDGRAYCKPCWSVRR